MRNLVWIAGTALLATVFFWVGQQFGRTEAPAVQVSATPAGVSSVAKESPIPVDQVFPNLLLADAEGHTFPLESLYDGRPIYLLALGATCVGCRFEVERWQRELGTLPPDLQIIGIAPDEFSTMKEAWKEIPPIFPVYRDVEGALQSAGIQDLPSGFGIGPSGEVITADYGIASMPSSRLLALREAMESRQQDRPVGFEMLRARAQ